MTLSDRQIDWLNWLYTHGGVGYCKGQLVHAGEARSNSASAISFLNLVAKGAIEGRDGALRLTDYGRRCLGLSDVQPSRPS